MATLTRPRPKPFTVEHFRAYTSHLVLDTGEYMELEEFQEIVVEPILDGVRETWAILPEGNAKSTLMAVVALYHADYTHNPWVPIGAAARDQAEILFGQAVQIVRSSPGMLERFRVYEGYRRIVSLRNGGRGIRVYAADVATGDGVIPTLALIDEGHRHPNLDLYRLWAGKLDKRNGQIVMISTAGEPGGDFEDTRDQIRDRAPQRTIDGAHVYCEGDDLVMNEWCLQDARDVANFEKVKEANPLSSITVESLRRKFDSPTTDLSNWKRFKCNIPARANFAAITDEEWDAARAIDVDGQPINDFPEYEHIAVGIDVAWKHDTFAIVPCWDNRDEGYRLLGNAEILIPPRDGSMLHPDAVKKAINDIYEFNPIDTAVMDMERGEDVAAWLEDEMGITVIDRTQGNAMAAEDYEEFTKALRSGELRHTGHGGLRSHVMNAISRALPSDKRRFDRTSQSRSKKKQERRVIDALTAAAMVNWFLASGPDATRPIAGEAADYRIQGF